tara:strand:- start:769 stop:933 length:165 start_codon:yes stop_codon:yes gene_type:complete
MSRVARWGDAVEKVAASLYGFEKIIWVTDTHQIARTIFWKNIVEQLEGPPHIRL